MQNTRGHPTILFSGKIDGLRKDIKTLFLMSKIAVIVNYKGFEEFYEVFKIIFN